jgi:hypothetical protein
MAEGGDRVSKLPAELVKLTGRLGVLERSGRIDLAPLRTSGGTLLRNLRYARSGPRQRSGPWPKTREKADGRRR